MPLYEIKATFRADTELTQEELADLIDSIALQIDEPVNSEGESADYQTGEVEIAIDLVLYKGGENE